MLPSSSRPHLFTSRYQVYVRTNTLCPLRAATMARQKMAKHLSFISVLSQLIPIKLSQSFSLSPKKSYPVQLLQYFTIPFPKAMFLLLSFLLILTLHLGLHLPLSQVPCCPFPSISARYSSSGNISEFWRQPNGMGYKPCLEPSEEYQLESVVQMENRRKYLVVVVAGGLNQQRNQIVDAVVIARILGATLVVPVLQVNPIWGDESEFSDIFDLNHFKHVLLADVRVVSSLPSTHIMARTIVEKQTPTLVSPASIRARYLKRLNKEGVLLLRGLDSRLSKDLPSDLQKLRCKVAFQALRFAKPIMELGNKLAAQMRSKGPYIALHLRLEKDVWVRTGCLPGLSPKSDKIIRVERKLHPKLLTGRSNMSYHERKLAGLCPLNALEVVRLLKALEAPSNARIYWAGGEPFGGKTAIRPLIEEFPNFYNKENLSAPAELAPFTNKASSLAAIDYIVCEQSDVFIPSHGGNMAHLMRGHRAFFGHKKFITPNKRQMIPYFLDTTLTELEFKRVVKSLHENSLGQPEFRTDRVGKDVTAFPVPECMCNGTDTTL